MDNPFNNSAPSAIYNRSSRKTPTSDYNSRHVLGYVCAEIIARGKPCEVIEDLIANRVTVTIDGYSESGKSPKTVRGIARQILKSCCPDHPPIPVHKSSPAMKKRNSGNLDAMRKGREQKIQARIDKAATPSPFFDDETP